MKITKETIKQRCNGALHLDVDRLTDNQLSQYQKLIEQYQSGAMPSEANGYFYMRSSLTKAGVGETLAHHLTRTRNQWE